MIQKGEPLPAADLSPDGQAIVTADAAGAARIWNAANSEPRGPRLCHHGPVRWAEFSPDGRFVVTASEDDTARVWAVENGEPQTPPLGHDGDVSHASFTSDGRYVITASVDGTARVWDATSTAGGTVAQLWNSATAKEHGLPLRHIADIQYATFSPDGRRVVTASDDRTARVWDAATGRPVCAELRHDAAVRFAAFSSDGGMVVTTASDYTARVWDASTGAPIAIPLRHPVTLVRHARFAPETDRVYTSSGLAVWKWSLPNDDRAADEIARLVQWVAGQQIDDSGGAASIYIGYAIAQVDAPISLRPRQWYLRQVRGEIMLQRERWKAAIDDLTKAIELGATTPDVWAGRGRAYRGECRPRTAPPCCRRCSPWSGAIRSAAARLRCSTIAAAPSKVSPQSAVYNLGATLYHVLTGRPPFQAASTPGVVAADTESVRVHAAQVH